MHRNTSGFTIIELLVVIAVVGILSTISLLSFTRYQADSRDTQRSSSATIIAEALEKYYDQNGEYPSCNTMTNTATVVSSALGGVDPKVLVAPQADTGQTNSIDLCTTLTAGVTTDSFAYVGDGSAACNTTSCFSYTLQYREESTGDIVSLESRRITNIATSNTTTLAASSISASQINLSWDVIENANSYELVRATNAGFTTGVTTTYPTSNSENVTGLSASTQYWFRVRGVSTGGNSAWSNDVNAFTRPAVPANPGASTTSSTSITVSWTNVTGATSYRVQRSTTPGFDSGTTGSVSGIAGTPHVQTGLQQGTQYWFRVYASNSAGEGAASTIVNATTTLPAPTGLATTPSNNSINFSWGAVTNATAYDVEYSTSPSFSPLLGSFNNLTGTSQNITGLSVGTLYYIRVEAKNAVTTSAFASTSDTTIVPAPTCLTATTNSTTQITASWAACPVGVADTYTLQYDDNSGFTTPTSITGLTTTSRAVTGLTQGRTHWFRVYALVGAASSAASPTANATTTISAPTGVSVGSVISGAVRRFDAGDWIITPDPTNWYYAYGTAGGTCPAGSTRQMYFSSNYNSPTTTRGPTGWGTASTKYDIQPTSGYGIRFTVYVRCVGTNATSGTVSSTSGYAYN